MTDRATGQKIQEYSRIDKVTSDTLFEVFKNGYKSATAQQIADFTGSVVNPRDALLDLVVSRLLDAGILEADAVVATGAPVGFIVSEKLQLFAKPQPAKPE